MASLSTLGVRQLGSLIFVGLCACTADTSLEGRTDLVGGTVTTARREVGRFRGCTATLFAPRYVISAAHCLNYPNYTDTTVKPGDVFRVETDTAGQWQSFPVDRLYSFAKKRYEYTPNREGEPASTTDITIIHLKTAVPANVATPARLADRHPQKGDRSTAFGYGCKDRDTNASGGGKQYLEFSYATPTRALCPGDSGGPAFFLGSGDRGELWGVNSDYIGTGAFATWTDLFGDVTYFKPQIDALMQRWDLEGGE